MAKYDMIADNTSLASLELRSYYQPEHFYYWEEKQPESLGLQTLFNGPWRVPPTTAISNSDRKACPVAFAPYSERVGSPEDGGPVDKEHFRYLASAKSGNASRRFCSELTCL